MENYGCGEVRCKKCLMYIHLPLHLFYFEVYGESKVSFIDIKHGVSLYSVMDGNIILMGYCLLYICFLGFVIKIT